MMDIYIVFEIMAMKPMQQCENAYDIMMINK